MNLGSPEKGLEEMSDLEKEDQYAVVGELDLNFAMDKEEKAEDYVYENLARSNKIQVDLNEQGHLGSPSLPADFGYDTLESPFEESHSPVQTGFDHDVAMRTNFVYDQERLQSPLKDNHFEEEMEEVRDSHFCKSSSQVKADSFHNEMGTEGFSHSAEFPSTKDSNRGGELEDHSNLDMPSSPLRDGKVKETFSEKLQYGLTKSAYEEVEEEATDHQTGKMFPSPRSRRGDSETKNKNFYHSRNSPTESRKLDIPHSGQDSPGRTPRRSKSLVTVRQMSFSPERPPSTHQCPSGQNPSSPKHDVQDLSYSSGSDWQKHSPLPERSDLGKGVPSKDNLLPSARRNSASPRRSRQGYHHKDGSSLKHVSTSQRTRYSPPNHRRQDRSLSRSPVRRRDSSSGYKRDYRDRSRSRSPYAIHRHRRSPRRRYSPRHRSPASGYHSHRRSPRRRPWSPPPNRSTGVGKPGKNLFVAGFSFLTTEKDLERKFSRFGRVRDVRIVRDKRSGDSRGFGFLSLERDEEADAAIRALDKTEWNGRIVLVEKSKSSGR